MKTINKQSKEEQSRAKNVLMDFLRGLRDQNLTVHEARENIKSGVIELVDYGATHVANGLLLSDDGFFVTCRHCIYENGSFSRRLVCLENMELHPIEYVCAMDECHDLAIVKAGIPADSNVRIYKTNDIVPGRLTPINLYTVRGNNLHVKFGHTRGVTMSHNGKYIHFKDHLRCKADAERGDSGCVVASRDGGLICLTSTIDPDYPGCLSGAQMYHVVELIKDIIRS